MTKEELDEIKSLIFDYIFPEPAYGVIEGMRLELKAKGFLELAIKCFDACQLFAKELIDKELEKRKEEKRK